MHGPIQQSKNLRVAEPQNFNRKFPLKVVPIKYNRVSQTSNTE